jgi:hypothetical protein
VFSISVNTAWRLPGGCVSVADLSVGVTEGCDALVVAGGTPVVVDGTLISVSGTVEHAPNSKTQRRSADKEFFMGGSLLFVF